MHIKKLSENNYVWSCEDKKANRIINSIYFKNVVRTLERKTFEDFNNANLTITNVVKNKDNDSIAIRFRIADRWLITEAAYPYVWIEVKNNPEFIQYEDLTENSTKYFENA